MPRGIYTRKATNNLAPVEKVTNREILWAAGFYEGEGTCGRKNSKGYNGSEFVGITQKNKEPLEFMQKYFGGGIYKQGATREVSQWMLGGARARGFLQTIYELVSARRQEQIAKAMGWE